MTTPFVALAGVCLGLWIASGDENPRCGDRGAPGVDGEHSGELPTPSAGPVLALKERSRQVTVVLTPEVTGEYTPPRAAPSDGRRPASSIFDLGVRTSRGVDCGAICDTA